MFIIWLLTLQITRRITVIVHKKCPWAAYANSWNLCWDYVFLSVHQEQSADLARPAHTCTAHNCYTCHVCPKILGNIYVTTHNSNHSRSIRQPQCDPFVFFIFYHMANTILGIMPTASNATAVPITQLFVS